MWQTFVWKTIKRLRSFSCFIYSIYDIIFKVEVFSGRVESRIPIWTATQTGRCSIRPRGALIPSTRNHCVCILKETYKGRWWWLRPMRPSGIICQALYLRRVLTAVRRLKWNRSKVLLGVRFPLVFPYHEDFLQVKMRRSWRRWYRRLIKYTIKPYTQYAWLIEK